MITYGFYDSTNHDRKYNSKQFGSLFDGIIKDGIFMSIGDAFSIKPGENPMTVSIGKGRAWFNHTWLNNDSIYIANISPSEMILKRIDAIVIDINSEIDVRANSIQVVKGVPSSNPSKPNLINNENHHQYPLAYISVEPNVTSIRMSDITSMIGTSTTPYVTGILETVDIDDLLNKWDDQWDKWYDSNTQTFTKEFEDWFDSIKGKLSEDAAGSLQNQIDNIVRNFNNLEIGGRNLYYLKNYNKIYKYGIASYNINNDGEISVVDGGLGAFYIGNLLFNDTDVYNMGMGPLMDVEGSNYVSYEISNNLFTNNFYQFLTKDKKRLDVYHPVYASSATISVPDDAKYMILRTGVNHTTTSSTYKFKIKVEKGNKHTDWTPAPEDVQNAIDSIKIGVRNLLFDTTLTSNPSDSGLANWIMGGMNNYVSKGYSNNGFHFATSSSGSADNNGPLFMFNRDNLGLKTGDTVTFSVDVKGTTGTGNPQIQYWSSTIQSSNLWAKQIIGDSLYGISSTFYKRLSITITLEDRYPNVLKEGFGVGGAFNSDIYIKNIKIERGDKATDWMPAPEDVDYKIVDVSDDMQGQIDTIDNNLNTTKTKVGWIIESGTSASNFTLTDEMKNQIRDTAGSDPSASINGNRLINGTVTGDKLNMTDVFSRPITATDFNIDSTDLKVNSIGSVELGEKDVTDYTHIYAGGFIINNISQDMTFILSPLMGYSIMNNARNKTFARFTTNRIVLSDSFNGDTIATLTKEDIDFLHELKTRSQNE